MSYYQLIGYIFKALIIISPIYLLIFCSSKYYYKAIKCFLCFGCTFCYDYRVFSISLMQIIMMMTTMLSIFQDGDETDCSKEKIKLVVLIYLIYMCLATIVGYLFKSDYKLKGSLVQNELRPIVQSVQHICTYVMMFAVMTLGYCDAVNIYKSFYVSLKLIALIAICQSVIYKFTSFDIFPMRKDFISESSGLSVVSKYGFLRATAGVGEPKQAAKFISLGIAMNLLGYEIMGWNRIRIRDLILFFAAMFFTFSTTGYIITVIILILFCLKYLKQGNALLTIPIIFVAIIAIIFIVNSPVITDKIVGGIESGEVIGLEDTDSTVIYWLKSEPWFLIFGTGLANVACYAYKYVPVDRSYVLGYPFTLRRGVIKFIADGGIVCLIFQLFIMFSLYNFSIRKNIKTKYFGIFILLMYFMLTCEALFEVELMLFALLYSLSSKSEKVINLEINRL